MFWFFGHEACGILAPRPEIKPAPPALEGEVLITGPLGKSQILAYLELKVIIPYNFESSMSLYS